MRATCRNCWEAEGMSDMQGEQTAAVAAAEGEELSIAQINSGKGDTPRSSWPFGGDHVMRATAAMGEEERALVRWLFFYCQENGVPLQDAAEKIGYSVTVVYRLCRGEYQAKDMSNVLAAIGEFRRECEQSQGKEQSSFVLTETARKVWQYCDLAREYHTIAFVWGDSQIGKTWALREYCRRNNHGMTKYFRMPSAAGTQLMIRELAVACAFSKRGCFEALRERVFGAIDRETLVIADEIHQSFVSYHNKARLSCLELLREIQDRTECGMVLCGTNTARDEITSGPHAKLLEQLNRRGIFKLQLPKHATARDTNEIAKRMAGIAAPTGEASDLVRQIIRDSGLKAFTTYLSAAGKLAVNRKQPLAWDHFVAAHAMVTGMSVSAA